MATHLTRHEISAFVLVLGHAAVACGQLPDYADEKVADIPVNYTEAKAGEYTLPDALVTASGARVADVDAWQSQRRRELIKIFEENEYGRAPRRPKAMRFEVVEEGSPAFDGKAIRKQVTIHFGEIRPNASDSGRSELTASAMIAR